MQLTVEDRETGHLVGDFGISPADHDPGVIKIGYTIAPEYQGSGYATEAVGALIDYAFDVLGVDIVRAGRGGRVDIGLALRRLGEVMAPPTFVQCEGGAQLNGALLASGCVDELDLTWSPVLAGGDGPRVTRGAPPTMTPFDLAHLGTEDGFLYGRWVRRRTEGATPGTPS